jgi:hypothetical protein
MKTTLLCHKPAGKRLNFRHLFIFTILASGIAFLTNCTYKSPAAETPVPSEEAVAKSFFVTSKVDAKTGKTFDEPRTFLCGWASERETGAVAESVNINNVVETSHCNLAFEITEKKMIGKMINPSFPTDPSRWQIAITIPILSHYYLEPEKDSAGRDTKKIIKNSNRSHWSARTHMDLDLLNINLDHFWGLNPLMSSLLGKNNLNVDNITWDLQNRFLGFTITANLWGSNYTRLRFNILGFEHNPNFKKTPFNDKNYKRMNVLHIVGEKVNGLHQILHAAHWDLSKTHEIRLWGFPEEYIPLMEEVVEDWNEAFQKIGVISPGKKAFVINKDPIQHAFDLRYPTMVWVSDEKISSVSPLGVGMALADVKNGEIKWGMVTLYGGMIERYVKSFTASGENLAVTNGQSGKNIKQHLTSMTFKNVINQNFMMSTQPQKVSGLLDQSFSNLKSETATQKINDSIEKKNAKKVSEKEVNSALSGQRSLQPEVVKSIFSTLLQTSQNKTQMAQQQLAQLDFQQLMNAALSNADNQEPTPAGMQSTQQKQNEFTNPFNKRFNPQSAIFCQGRTFADVSGGWKQAIAASGKDDKAALRHVIKELISHEFGHFLGLGHQFKENILPNKDEVPEEIYNQLAAKANEENGYSNYTSVMGYRDPRSEIMDNSDLKPGPQDLLVLKFLYQQKYATYKKGDKDFTYFDVPASGIIPDFAPGKTEYKTSYFPQCNDIDASLAIDPFCNRFDRGHNAMTIAQNYFANLNDTLLQQLYAFTDVKNGNAEYNEYFLWMKSFQTLGRARLFYDYMRVYYKNEIDQIRNDEEALLEFSSGCQQAKTQNAKLNKIFTEKPMLKELCQTNAYILSEMKNLVSKNVTDFTKKDILSRYSPGGMDAGDVDRDWSRFEGAWTEMSGLPLKFASLFALTASQPWNDFNYMPLYNSPHYKFSYSSLYPKEYTEIIAANVKHNLKFASLGQSEKTGMGRSVLALGWLLAAGQMENNDAGLLPQQFLEKIRNQQKFDFSMVAVVMKGRKKENNPNFVDGFDGTVYDFNSEKETPLTNAYLLPGGQIFASASSMFIYPITRFMPFSDDSGYAIAYKLNFTRDSSDPLSDFSVKTDLNELHNRLINACVMGSDGVNNGLSHFFTSTESEFPGFKMPVGLARAEEKRKEFLDSIDTAFNLYHNSKKFSKQPQPETCQESLRGLGLIISSAAVMNGFWLPEVMDYIQK